MLFQVISYHLKRLRRATAAKHVRNRFGAILDVRDVSRAEAWFEYCGQHRLLINPAISTA